MPTPRVSMQKFREVLRLKAAGLSLRPIARSVGLSLGAVAKYTQAADAAGLTWPLPDALSDAAVARLLSGGTASTSAPLKLVPPDYPMMHQELKRKGVTRQLLWQEYREQNGAATYAYSQFCENYRAWCKTLKRSMRQVHRAGEKLFVDYAGQTVPIINARTGEITTAQIFVAVLGASNYTFAEATLSQRLPDWLNSHVHAFEFMQGSVEIVVPDNLRSGVTKACRYEPEINPSYAELAAHYRVAVIPARPFRPTDKEYAS